LVQEKTFVTELSFIEANRQFMKRNIKKAVGIGTGVIALLVVVLAVHIYLVTRPKADEHTVALARIDIGNDINEADAAKISGWLSQQEGVSHVLCNPESNIVVFTFQPIKADANDIAGRFASTFHYNAKRHLPSREEMGAGCPAFAGGWSGRITTLVSSIF